MKPTRGLYAIVQYCPDPSRLESANIGVLLFCHSRAFCKVSMSVRNRRAEQFVGLHSSDALIAFDAAKESFADRVEMESPAWLTCSEYEGRNGLAQFVRHLANQIRMTTPRPMKVGVPKEELERLYRDLVMDPERK